MTTTAERLDQLANGCALAWRDLLTWQAERENLRPDGYSASTGRASGMPHGKGGVSDPTLNAVERRRAMDAPDGQEHVVELARLAAHLLELSIGIVSATIGHDPTMGAWATSPVERLQTAALGLSEASKMARGLRGACVPYRGLLLDPRDACDSIQADLQAFRAIVPAPRHEGTFTKDELCHGNKGTAYACNHDHEKLPVPAVWDGLCQKGYERRRYQERKTQESAA